MAWLFGAAAAALLPPPAGTEEDEEEPFPPFLAQIPPEQDPNHSAYLGVAHEAEAQPAAGWQQDPAGGASQQQPEQQGMIEGEEQDDAAWGSNDDDGWDSEEVDSSSEEEEEEEEEVVEEEEVGSSSEEEEVHSSSEEGGSSSEEEEEEWEDAAEAHEEGGSDGSQPQGSGDNGVQLLPRMLGSPRPKVLEPTTGPLASFHPLLSLRPAPTLLRHMKRAAERRRGKLGRRKRQPDSYLPDDEKCSQLLGCSQEWVSQPSHVPTDTMEAMCADVGEAFYWYQRDTRDQLHQLWQAAKQVAGQLEAAHAELEQLHAAGQQGDELRQAEARVQELNQRLRECEEQLAAAAAEKQWLHKALSDKEQELAAEQTKARKAEKQAAFHAQAESELEEAAEAAAASEAELRRELERAQERAAEEREEGRHLRQQLAELQEKRRQELADAEHQQEAAAAEQRRLAGEVQHWRKLYEEAAQPLDAPGAAEQLAAQRDAALAECTRLQQALAAKEQEAAALQQEKAQLQAASADVLAQVQHVAAAAAAQAQELQAAKAMERGPTTVAAPVQPQLGQAPRGRLTSKQQRRLARLLQDGKRQRRKLGQTFSLLQALHSNTFWQAVAQNLGAQQELVRHEGVRLIAEMALAGQQAAQAAATEAQHSAQEALKQVGELQARLEAHHAATAAPDASKGAAGQSYARGEQQADVFDLLVQLQEAEDALAEARADLEKEQQEGSCMAWRLLNEARKELETVRERVQQLERQLADSQAEERRHARAAAAGAAELRRIEEQQTAKKARREARRARAAAAAGPAAEPAAPAAAAAQLQQPVQPAARKPAQKRRKEAMEERPAVQQHKLTPELLTQHGAFALLMIQPPAPQSESGSSGGKRKHGKKRRVQGGAP